MKVDLQTTEELAPLVPSDRLVVGESGIYDPDDLDRLAAAGARCFLVGESLMRAAMSRPRRAGCCACPDLSHTDLDGRAAHGRRLGQGRDRPGRGRRRASRMRPETLARIQAGESEGRRARTARIAGIMAAKRTGELIPLCHPLPLTGRGRVELRPGGSAVEITATCRLKGRPASRWRR